MADHESEKDTRSNSTRHRISLRAKAMINRKMLRVSIAMELIEELE